MAASEAVVIGPTFYEVREVAQMFKISRMTGLGLFVATPAGAGLPEALSEFLTALNSASTPVLTEPVDGSGAVG